MHKPLGSALKRTALACLPLLLLLSSCDSDHPFTKIGPSPPPIKVTYRESALGLGIVMIIQNQSNEILYDLRVRVEAPNGKTTSANVVDALKPAETKEVGWMELDHWTLEVGENISVYARNYSIPYRTFCSGKQ